MKYIEEEIEPIPFLEDWWGYNEEYEGFMCKHGDFERGKDGQDDE